MTRARLYCAAIAAIAIAPSQVSASGFLVARFGGEHGNVTSDHITSLYYNPAGLALDTGTRLYIEGLFGYRSVGYDRPEGAIDNVVEPGDSEAGTPVEAVSANAGSASLFNPVAAPFLAVASDFGVQNLGVAVGLSVPFGGSSQWDKNTAYEGDSLYPGAVDGVQRWTNIEGSAQSIYITAAGAYRIPAAKLSVGLGVNVVRTAVKTLRARNANGADHLLNGTGGLQEGRARLDVSGTHLSLAAGVNWQPMDNLWIAASYQSRPGFTKSNLSGTLRTKLGAAAESEGDIDATWALPDVARLGARYRPTPNIEVRAFGEFVRWSVLENHCGLMIGTGDECIVTDTGEQAPSSATISFVIPRHWHNTFGLRGGASYWLGPDTELFAGLGFDPSAVPDDMLDASLMDLDKLTASLGGRLAVNEAITLAATYTQVIYIEKTVEPRPRDSAGDPIAPLLPPSRVPDNAGTYSSSVGVLSLGAEYAF